MPYLTVAQEKELLRDMYPSVSLNDIHSIASIAETSRETLLSDSGKITTALSTRSTIEMAGLIHDGFSLEEAAEVCVFPLFSNDGGAESERVFMKQVVQKYITANDDVFNLVNNPFNRGRV
jgi:hypothetical protein